jgi:hypothetical protein
VAKTDNYSDLFKKTHQWYPVVPPLVAFRINQISHQHNGGGTEGGTHFRDALSKVLPKGVGSLVTCGISVVRSLFHMLCGGCTVFFSSET